MARDKADMREAWERKAAADAVAITQLEKAVTVTQQKLTALTRGETTSPPSASVSSLCLIPSFPPPPPPPPHGARRPVADYLLQRHAFQARDKAARERVAEVEAALRRQSDEAARYRSLTVEETRTAKSTADKALRGLSTEMTMRSELHGDEVKAMRAQHAAITAALHDQIADLQHKLAAMTKK
jgi:hypothetical protein